MANDEEVDYLLKIVIVGDSGVGKTNLLSRFTRDYFQEDTRNTIGVDFFAMDLKVDNKSVKAQFWDTAGQEKYKAIASAYYKNAQGAIIVYDITRRETFDNVDSWLSELRQFGDPNITLMILGNKTDLVANRQVLTDEGRKLAESAGAFFMEVSGKLNEHHCVNTAFNAIISDIIKRQEYEMHQRAQSDLLSLKSKGQGLEKVIKENEEKKGCCKS